MSGLDQSPVSVISTTASARSASSSASARQVAGWRRSGRMVRKIVLASRTQDGDQQDRIGRVAGGGNERDADREAGPPQERDERTEPAETGHRARVELGAEPGATAVSRAAQLVPASATRGARRRRGRALELRAGLGQGSFLKRQKPTYRSFCLYQSVLVRSFCRLPNGPPKGAERAAVQHSPFGDLRYVGSSAVLLVGLTGGIGAGKSTVADLLTERGAIVIDGDVIARRVVEPGQPALAAIVERFGPEVLGPDGRLDRPALAAKAFASDEDRLALEAITHPAIGAEFVREMTEAPPDSIVVNDVPLLVESQKAAERGYEAVIVVEAPRAVRLDRLEARGLDPGRRRGPDGGPGHGRGAAGGGDASAPQRRDARGARSPGRPALGGPPAPPRCEGRCA